MLDDATRRSPLSNCSEADRASSFSRVLSILPIYGLRFINYSRFDLNNSETFCRTERTNEQSI